MFRLKTNSKGFAPLLIVLAVIVVVVIGFGGWSVYHSRHNKAQNNIKPTDTTKPDSAGSGIKGTSVLGVSTGCLNGNCSQPPHQATIDIKTANGTREGGSILATIKTDAGGNFSVDLKPGTYMVSPRPDNNMYASNQIITVTANKYTTVTITYN